MTAQRSRDPGLPSGLVIAGTVRAGVLAASFGRAASFLTLGRAEAAMVALLPLGLDEGALHRRVHDLVRVAAVITGVLPRDLVVSGHPVAPQRAGVISLADELVAYGARLDGEAVDRVISVQCAGAGQVDEVLVDVLCELVARYAAGEQS